METSLGMYNNVWSGMGRPLESMALHRRRKAVSRPGGSIIIVVNTVHIVFIGRY